jgi:hypothetical protein
MEKLNLTANEKEVLVAIATSNCGIKNVESLRGDAYSWTGVTEVAEETFKTVPVVKGTVSSLSKKGLVNTEEGDSICIWEDEETIELIIEITKELYPEHFPVQEEVEEPEEEVDELVAALLNHGIKTVEGAKAIINWLETMGDPLKPESADEACVYLHEYTETEMKELQPDTSELNIKLRNGNRIIGNW